MTNLWFSHIKLKRNTSIQSMYCSIWITLQIKIKFWTAAYSEKCVMTRRMDVFYPGKSQTKQLENLNRAVEWLYVYPGSWTIVLAACGAIIGGKPAVGFFLVQLIVSAVYKIERIGCFSAEKGYPVHCLISSQKLLLSLSPINSHALDYPVVKDQVASHFIVSYLLFIWHLSGDTCLLPRLLNCWDVRR